MMKKLFQCFLMLISVLHLKAQYGILPNPYCMPLYSMLPCNQPGPSNSPGAFVNDFIHSVVTVGGNQNISNLNTGCNSQMFPSIGTRNYIYHKCQHQLKASPSQVITCSVQTGNDYAQGIAIFVDWNLNNIFDVPAERLAATVSTIPGGTWAALTFTVPPSQPSGVYRMRIRCARLTNGTSIDPCMNYTYGEVEDYEVHVGNISPYITATVTANSPLCAGSTLSMNVAYTSTYTPVISWTGPSSFSSSTQSFSISNVQSLNAGNYTVSLTGGQCPISISTSVVVLPVPTLTVTSTASAVCAGFYSTLTAVTNGNPEWAGNTFSFTLNQPSLVASPGSFTVTSTWTNNACESKSVVNISALPQITLSLAQSAASVCAGSAVTFSLSGAQNYSWQPCNYLSNCSSATATSVPLLPIQYTVVGTSPNCSDTLTVNIGVTQNPSVTVVSSSSVLCVGGQATLTAAGAQQYTWMPSGTGSVIVVSPSVTASYTLSGSNADCLDSAVYTQSVSVCTDVSELLILSDSLLIYPNPFKDILYLKDFAGLLLEFYNTEGKMVYKTRVSAEGEAETHVLSPGLYLIRLQHPSGEKLLKLLKQ